MIEKIAAISEVELAAVLIETKAVPDRGFAEKLKRSIKYDGYLETAKKFLARFLGAKTAAAGEESQASDMRNTTAAAARARNIAVETVDDYHAPSTINLIKGFGADLAVIYGTNIIKENVFSIPRLGSINLHQGLAPYYRGGPPVFWELFNDEKEVGLTVHFVAAKVDTGDIILQRTVPLAYDQRYGDDFEGFIAQYKNSLREDCAEMVAEAVSLVVGGDFPRVKQDTTLGKRYRLPVKAEKDELRRRLRQRLGK